MTYNNNVIIILSYLHTSPRLTHDKSYNLPAVVNVQVHNMIACQSCKTLLRLFRSTHPFKLFSIRWRTYQGWPNGRRRSIYLQQSIAYDLRVDLGYFFQNNLPIFIHYVVDADDLDSRIPSSKLCGRRSLLGVDRLEKTIF